MNIHLEDINTFYDLVLNGLKDQKREFANGLLKLMENGNKIVFGHKVGNEDFIPEKVFDDLKSITDFFHRHGISLSESDNYEPDILTITMIKLLENANEIAERLFPGTAKPIYTFDGTNLFSTVLTLEQRALVDKELSEINWL